MREITVSGFRLPFEKGSSVPGFPGVKLGKKIGGSPYTFNRIYDLLDQEGQQTGLVIKVGWQPLGVPLGMSMRALQHEWLLYQNIEVFCRKHPELASCFLHAHTAIFVSHDPPVPPSAGAAAGSVCEPATAAAPSPPNQGHVGSSGAGGAVWGAPESTNSHNNNSSSSSSKDRGTVIEDTAASGGSSGSRIKHRSIAALIIEKANGPPVKRTIKSKAWADAAYLAQLLLQIPRALAVLEDELGFVHDDLRLDNILEEWQQQQQQQQQQQLTAAPQSSSRGGTSEGSSNSSAGLEAAAADAGLLRGGPSALAAAPAGRDSEARHLECLTHSDQLLQCLDELRTQQQWRSTSSPSVSTGAASPAGTAAVLLPMEATPPLLKQRQPALLSSCQQQHLESDQGHHGCKHHEQDRQQPEHQQQPQQRCDPVHDVTFKLFDFGLSMVNPDRYSLGPQARATKDQKKAALQQLQQQGYTFHKALGWVSLFHELQFGRTADLYRLCQSLGKHLNGRTWPAADRPLVEACLQLLAAVSCTRMSATFTDDWRQHNAEHWQRRQWQQQEPEGATNGGSGAEAGAGGGDSSSSSSSYLSANMKLTVQIKPMVTAEGSGNKGPAQGSAKQQNHSGNDCGCRSIGIGSGSGFGKPLLAVGRWLQQRKWQRRMKQKARHITAVQLQQLGMYQHLAAVAGVQPNK